MGTSNDESMRLLAKIYPGLKGNQHQEILQCALNLQDPVAVESHFRILLAVLKMQCLECAFLMLFSATRVNFAYSVL
jgi:hypothetical protein